MFGLSAVFLVLSGAAALTYQVVWVRLLALTVGATTAAVSTVLAAFFLGISLGSAIAPRLTGSHPFRRYLGLEAAIGVSGLVLLGVLPELPGVVAALPTQHLAVRFLLSIGLLLIPTVCMGASFPVLVSFLVRDSGRLAPDLGRLYAANTAGAVLGAGLSGFVLVPRWGLDGAGLSAVGLNFLIVATGTAAGRRAPPLADPPPEPDRTDPRTRPAALGVLALTGFVSIATEVGWTRVLVLLTGSTVYGFATILTVFLAGIALGSWLVRRRLARAADSGARLAAGLLALGAAMLGTRALLGHLPAAFDLVPHLEGSPVTRFAGRFAVVAAVLFLPTLLFGAVFPLALSTWCGGVARMRRDLGRGYAVNTVASVAGSIVAGFWWIPRLGTDSLLVGTAVLTLAAAVVIRPRPGIAAAAVGGILLAWVGPGLRLGETVAAAHRENEGRGPAGEAMFLAEGRTGIISAVRDGSGIRILNNGLSESFVDPRRPGGGSSAEALLGLVPWALHGEARRAFVVGYGGGVTVRALVPTGLREIRVAEIEPVVLDAVRAVLGPDAVAIDGRVTVELTDARHALLRSEETWDLIVSQPSHPWLAGASALFTAEFFELVRSRLAPAGVFGQWLNLFRMDAATLRAILGTFFDVFPYGFTLALPETGDLLLFGSAVPLTLRADEVAERLGTGDGPRDVADILLRFAWSRREAVALARGVPRNTDRNVLSETRLAALAPGRKDLAGNADPYALLRRTSTFDLAGVVPPGEIAPVLRELGDREVGRENRLRARAVIARLAEYDPEGAERLASRLGARARIPTSGR